MGITMGTGGASGCSVTVTSPKQSIFCLANISAVWFSIISGGFRQLGGKCKGGMVGNLPEVEGGGVGVACKGGALELVGGGVGFGSWTSTLTMVCKSSWMDISSSDCGFLLKNQKIKSNSRVKPISVLTSSFHCLTSLCCCLLGRFH